MEIISSSNILIVDDEEDLCDLLAFEFERVGFKAFTANSGNSAFEVVTKSKIDIILSDVRMPDGNGIDLLERLKESQSKHPPLIFMTAHCKWSEAELLAMGAKGVFSKPFVFEELLTAARNALLFPNSTPVRRYDRHPVNLRVTMVEQTSSHNISSTTLNLGLGGMFVSGEMDNKIVAGSKLSFSIETEKIVSKPILGSGIVKWFRHNSSEGPAGFGVEFSEFSGDSKATLSTLEERLRSNMESKVS